MTEREIYQMLFRHEKPPRFPKRSAFQLNFIPGERSEGNKSGPDMFGVEWYYSETDGTKIVRTGTRCLRDIVDWKRVMPDIDKLDWAKEGEKVQAKYDRTNCIQVVGMHSSHFERLQNLLGFEDALTSFYEDPESVHDFFKAITELKIKEIRKIKEYYNPDGISPHDDWGTNRNMFFSPQIWREFIKPELKQLVTEAHENNMFFEQHTCGYVTSVVADMVECGVDACEIQAVNDLVYIKENFGDKLVLRGCFNGQVLSRPGITEEEVRKEIRTTLQICAKDGGFIAQIMWGINDPKMQDAIRDELHKFEQEYYGDNQWN